MMKPSIIHYIKRLEGYNISTTRRHSMTAISLLEARPRITSRKTSSCSNGATTFRNRSSTAVFVARELQYVALIPSKREEDTLYLGRTFPMIRDTSPWGRPACVLLFQRCDHSNCSSSTAPASVLYVAHHGHYQKRKRPASLQVGGCILISSANPCHEPKLLCTNNTNIPYQEPGTVYSRTEVETFVQLQSI